MRRNIIVIYFINLLKSKDNSFERILFYENGFGFVRVLF